MAKFVISIVSPELNIVVKYRCVIVISGSKLANQHNRAPSTTIPQFLTLVTPKLSLERGEDITICFGNMAIFEWNVLDAIHI
jgi:hypothetical protein